MIPILQEAGWASGLFWADAEKLAPTGIRSRTVQPVASRCTDWANADHTRTINSSSNNQSITALNVVFSGNLLQPFCNYYSCLRIYIYIYIYIYICIYICKMCIINFIYSCIILKCPTSIQLLLELIIYKTNVCKSNILVHWKKLFTPTCFGGTPPPSGILYTNT